MSSNHQHITPPHLSRDNYEEAFLLYVDDELSAEQKAAVEAFAALHPDLQEELDILLNTKLPAVDVPIFDKSTLFADSMKANTVDEDLLLYIDNELPAAQKAAVEEKIKQDKDYSLQHQLLAKTKLDASEKIVFPYKESLYRKEKKRVVYAQWWRVAAAAVVLLWAGTFDWSGTNDAATPAGPVALQAPPAQQPATSATKNHTAAIDEEVAAGNQAPAAELAAVTNQKEKERFTPQVVVPVQNSSTETAVAAAAPAASRITGVQTSADYIPEMGQQIFNDAVVTSAEPVRTISTDAHTTTPVPVEDAVASAGQERGGSLKGFLRKTTRFIERTTSINPVNADDELLIGALAIKVK